MAGQEFDTLSFRNALGNFATGVTVVTAKGENGTLAGVTANSFNSVSLVPPMVLWSLDRSSPSLKVLEGASHFCVHILAEGQNDLSMIFAKSGDDKFNGIKYIEGLGDAPILDGCLAYFECRNVVHHDGGDHVIIVGEVERFETAEGDPLIFFRGQLGDLAPLPKAD
jgi:3-hydroxy-9,10-secoandrosta-1,3,5(10)-triene-9,17-dione monooxygenase reductase component